MRNIRQPFFALANLLNELMAETIYTDYPDFEMPEIVIYKTAEALQYGFDAGEFGVGKDEHTDPLYYSGMIEDYGGYLDRYYELYKPSDENT